MNRLALSHTKQLHIADNKKKKKKAVAQSRAAGRECPWHGVYLSAQQSGGVDFDEGKEAEDEGGEEAHRESVDRRGGVGRVEGMSSISFFCSEKRTEVATLR